MNTMLFSLTPAAVLRRCRGGRATSGAPLAGTSGAASVTGSLDRHRLRRPSRILRAVGVYATSAIEVAVLGEYVEEVAVHHRFVPRQRVLGQRVLGQRVLGRRALWRRALL
jgi:hypothetical protein